MKATADHITTAAQIAAEHKLTAYDWTIGPKEIKPHVNIVPDYHLLTNAPLMALSLGGIDTYPIRSFLKGLGFAFDVDRKWRKTFPVADVAAISATVKQLMRIKALQADRLAVYPQ